MTYFIDPVTNKSTFSFFSEFSIRFKGQVIIELLLLIAITVCGIVGNLLVIVSTLMYKHMRTTSNIFLSFQASWDLIFCCTIPLVIVVRFTKHWTLGNIACKILMFIFTCSQGITTLCMSALSIDRYLCICRPEKYNFLKQHPYVTLTIIFMIGIAVNSPFIIGWNTLTIEKDGVMYTFCGLRWPHILDDKIYICTILFFDFFVPLLNTGIVYSVIWLQVKESAKRVVNITSTGTTGSAGTKLLKILLLSVCLYVLMFVPFVSASILLFYSNAISSSGYLFIVALLFADTVVNPVLLPIFNVKYRACMQATITCKLLQQSKRVMSTIQRPRLRDIQSAIVIHTTSDNGIHCST